MLRNAQTPRRRAEARRLHERLIVEEQAGASMLTRRSHYHGMPGRHRGRAAPLHTHSHGRR
jgi:hypothetical protein